MNFKEEQIVYKNVDELIPYQNNPRINKEAVKYVSESIKNYGFRNPIILDKNDVIIAGHTRLESAKKLGFTQVPCIVADDLSEKQAKALRLLDNKTAEFAEWDFDLLKDELAELDFGDLEIDWYIPNTEFEENNEHLREQEDIDLEEYESNKKQVECPSCGFKFEVYNA